MIVLDPEVIQEIERIGKDRRPAEACGVLLPFKFKGQQVLEMPNRSATPHDEFVMRGSDVKIALEDFCRVHPSIEIWARIAVWHTHPKGNVGPSRADLENKPEDTDCLVVSLHDDEPAKPTWY